MLSQQREKNKIHIPLFLQPVHAGFPSPADDFLESEIDFNEVIVKHPLATFCVRVKGDSMQQAGYNPGDILVVDKSVTPVHNSPIIASLHGEAVFKILYKQSGRIYLLSANPKYKPIRIGEESDLEIWGVVICSLHYFKSYD